MGTSVDSAAGEASVAAWSDSGMIVGGSGWKSSCELGITSVVDLSLALPELATASCVVVAWAGAISLILLVVSNKSDLDGSGNGEEEAVDNRNSEYSRVQSASIVECVAIDGIVIVGAVADRSSDVTTAAACTILGHNSHSNESADEENVKDYCDETEEADATQEAGKENTKDCVKTSCAADTLNSLPLVLNWQIVVCEDCEEVGEDAQRNC